MLLLQDSRLFDDELSEPAQDRIHWLTEGFALLCSLLVDNDYKANGTVSRSENCNDILTGLDFSSLAHRLLRTE